MAIESIDRPPRIQPELPAFEVPIPAPPDAKQDNQNWMMMMLPILMSLIFMLSMGLNNPFIMVMMGGMMTLSIGFAVYNIIKQRREMKRRLAAYKATLLEMRQDMERWHNVQRLFYHHNYPDAQTVSAIAARRDGSRFGPRIWERRPADRDFGQARLGIGTRASTTIYKLGQAGDPLDENLLGRDAQKLQEDSRWLDNAPITVPLCAGMERTAEGEKPIPARHTIGIYGKNNNQVSDFARAMIANIATFHAPGDLRIFVTGYPQAKRSWDWCEWLPHCFIRAVGDDEEGQSKSDQICLTDEKDEKERDHEKERVSMFWKRIKRELDGRQTRLRDTDNDTGAGGQQAAPSGFPLLLVVVDLLGETPPNSPFVGVAAESAVHTINTQGPRLNAAIIFLANDASRIPSDCTAMCEVASTGDKTVFRYTETGLNTPRYLGSADLLNANDARNNVAAQLRRLELQKPFGADLPRAVDMLQMQSVYRKERIQTVDKLPFVPNWQRSLEPKNSEWLRVPIGMASSRDVRTLVLSAKEDGDGVHGLIAGTTGSGKSELLLTLVAGLAINYDPRIVNFVLVDFKGGSAFEPFKKLPHVVNILTNLQANAVERMFVAIQAVIDQRSKLLADSNMKDLVDYRQKRPFTTDPALPPTFPHLCIVVDEFAEMITANPDYRHQFESITRLGRAVGVTLILATQRPEGVVSDQMRANMKFRICLRVETPGDSKELLGQPDAAFLPNIGGRGYIQAGNDLLQGVQMARTGGDYRDDRSSPLKDVIWLDEEPLPPAARGDVPLFTAQEIAEALEKKPGELPVSMVDWIVGIAAIHAERGGVPVQTKPWPEPLPLRLTLTDPVDARYLNTERPISPDKTLVIAPNIKDWMDNADEKPIWKPRDWKNPSPLGADVGLIDNPYLAEQRLLRLNVSEDPIALFGASGRGKSTFIKTLLTTLAAERSPSELHIYMLDFGRGGLKAIAPLPHVGASLDASENARVDQLIRMLRSFVTERQELLAKFNNLSDYNARNPDKVLPEIVVVVDNFAEFRDSFDYLEGDLISLVRDGRQFGVYFIVTGILPNDLPSKLYNLFTRRLSLAQADPMNYLDIVGSGARRFDDVPGRGLIAVMAKDKVMPLEFHIGMPGSLDAADNDVDEYLVLSQRMERAWASIGGKRPAAELPKSITLLEMFERIETRKIEALEDLNVAEKWGSSMTPANQEWLGVPVGLVSSKDIRALKFQAQADGVHGMIAGTTGSGKSELLQTLIAAMAIRYDPRLVNFVLVDYKGGPTIEPFRYLPHKVDMATNLEGNAVERIFIAIRAEMDRRSTILAKAGVSDLVEYRKKVIPSLRPGSELPDTFPHLFVIVDEFAEMITINPEYRTQFEQITRLGRSVGVSLILATQRPAGVVSEQMRSNMKFRIALRVETPEDSKELLKRPDAARLPQIAGRGYIQAGTETLTEVQVAWSGSQYTPKAKEGSYALDEVTRALHATEAPRSTLAWLVGALAAEAKRLNIPRQRKPWPDPLPGTLPMNLAVDANYLPETPDDTIVLNPDVEKWVNAATQPPKAQAALWRKFDWSEPLPLKAVVGIVDDPFNSIQRKFVVDAGGDPIVAFGASGKGKSTFIKSVVMALAAQHSPRDLHVYALDFGRGGLRALRNLPHCGAYMDTPTPDRIGGLFRMIRGIMAERQERLANYPSREDYNAQKLDVPDALMPSMIVAIDNFAEFKENFEDMIPELISLVRDGRQFGIHFIITGSSLVDVPSKLYNVMGQRLTFTLADPMSYMDVVGRTSLSLPNVPGRGLVQLDGRPLEFHVATPVIDGEKDAFQRLSGQMLAAWDAVGGKRPSAEIPRAITLLDMFARMEGKNMERMGDLEIARRWRESMEVKNQDWLQASIGMINSREVRTLKFNAKAGGDGVHGMGAGTTGSGKSELLQTLIASMAIRYDPRIVNFVLIDYKGGPTVEPFRKLPHTVDVATNMEGNAVDRIFTAIKAEIDRRNDILARAQVSDLVEYRKRVIPTLKPGSPFPNTFPHLFVIVDEFAEMISANPDYRAQFETITRLGRNSGVSLILATQRPSGVVSDQMRANMKFRLCLRVETADDSKEMLGRNDAVTLPAIPGRGYLQVGGGGTSEFQAAYSGAMYDETKPDPAYPVDDIMQAIKSDDPTRPNDPPRSLLGWLVGAMALEAQQLDVPKQPRPWPSPLPNRLPLNKPIDASYMKDVRGPDGEKAETTILSPGLAEWEHNTDDKPIWMPYNWLSMQPQPLKAVVGVLDNPSRAEQRLHTLNLSNDPVLVMGASGRGKTTFLKTAMLTLAAQYSPADLHMYVLDFGRGGMKGVRALPHIGGIVDASEPERVERFFRVLFSTISERQTKTQAYDSMEEYNAKNPDAAFPAMLVVIDNVSEFRELYEAFLGDLITLVREGRSFGVTFALSGALMSDVPSKLFNILTGRVTFLQSDPSDYTSIVGRGWTRIPDVPGRGLATEIIDERPTPLEFHTGIPEMGREVDGHRIMAERMGRAWQKMVAEQPELRFKRAQTIEPLPAVLPLADVLPAFAGGKPTIAASIGTNDLDRKPTLVELGVKGPHWMIVGPPMSGKTTALRSLVLSLAWSYPPERLAMILVDPSDSMRRFFSFGEGDNRLDTLPHVLATASTGKELGDVIKRLSAEYDEAVIAKLSQRPDVFNAVDNTKRAIVLIMDHYDDAGAFNKGGPGAQMLAEAGKGKNLHIILGGSKNILSGSGDELRKRVDSARYIMVLQDIDTVRYIGARVANSGREMPPGRGYQVKSVKAELAQVALPAVEGRNGQSEEAQVVAMIQRIREAYAARPARWSYFAPDLAQFEVALTGETKPEGETQTAEATSATGTLQVATTDEQAELLKLLQSFSDPNASPTFNIDIPEVDPSRMVSLEVELPDKQEEKGKE